MIARLEQLLKTLVGLDARTLGQGAIERALRQRLSACNVEEGAYWTLVSDSPTEQRALIEATVVPETWFFRYPESFALLTAQARLIQRRRATGLPLRILSLPCSSGEEPYSIAMAMLDAGFVADAFRIEALDVSQLALDLAVAGCYGSNAFRSEDLGFRDRYFRGEGDGTYRVSKEVRDTVRFQFGNLLDDAVLPASSAYDIVFCRNLLIYFDRPTQLQALVRLKQWLQVDGLLFVGPAEAGLMSQRGMEALDTAHSFAFRMRTTPPPPPLPHPTVTFSAHHAQPASPVSLAASPAAARKATGSSTTSATSLTSGGAASVGMAHIASLANAGRSTEALSACVQQLAQYGPSAELFFWWGLLCDGQGQRDAAQQYYRKALYLDPLHAQTMAHLSALLAAQGDRMGAERLQQRLKQREAHDDSKR